MANINIGISSCLLGNNVRFDAGHKRNAYINNVLSKHFDFKSFCPEMAIGLPAPRKPIRLVDKNDIIDIIEPSSGESYLTKLQNYANEMHPSELDGFIFKKDSPSCGAFRVKTYHENGNRLHNDGVGGFAGQFMKNFPNIPVEEEGRLNDLELRNNFIQRVFLYHEIKSIYSINELIQFHTRNKFIFSAYHQIFAKGLGRLIASYNPEKSFLELKEEYVELLMIGTKRPPKRTNQVNAMFHILGYLKHSISKEEKKDVIGLIEKYREGKIDIVEPLSIIKYLVRHNGSEYIKEQEYIQREFSEYN